MDKVISVMLEGYFLQIYGGKWGFSDLVKKIKQNPPKIPIHRNWYNFVPKSSIEVTKVAYER